MGKVESLLKTEIVRLSKREVRLATAGLREDVKRLKARELELRRSVKALHTDLLAARAKERVVKMREAVSQEKVQRRLSPKIILRLRTRLGLSQSKFAGLVGASLPSVTNWERGKSTPNQVMRGKILALRTLKKRDIRNIENAQN